MKRKMVLIGAGSAMFTQGVVLDLIKNPGGFEWELCLVDIDEQVLEGTERLVRKILKHKDADIKLSAEVDRKRALPGADYVVCTIGVGGRRAWEQDVFIPRKYGIFQPVGDTAMPGGISRAMRMVPAMIDIVDDCVRLCPKARFFNYSNPMAVICRAIYKARNYPMTGLCIGVPGSEWELADLIGVPRSEFRTVAVGVNHMTFIYKMYVDGQDAKPMIDAALKEKGIGVYADGMNDKFFETYDETDGFKSIGDPYAYTFYQNHGAFPAPGDRHITEFMTEQFPGGAYYGRTLGVNAYSFEGTISSGDKIHEHMMQVGNSPEPIDEEYFKHIHGEHELLMDIINAMEHDSRKVFSVNLPNRGAVTNLPYDAVLELPAIATADGFRPIQINDFPQSLAGYVLKALNIFELTVDAALQCDRNLFIEAILAGGYLPDRKKVESMVDELMQAQAQYLPR